MVMSSRVHHRASSGNLLLVPTEMLFSFAEKLKTLCGADAVAVPLQETSWRHTPAPKMVFSKWSPSRRSMERLRSASRSTGVCESDNLMAHQWLQMQRRIYLSSMVYLFIRRHAVQRLQCSQTLCLEHLEDRVCLQVLRHWCLIYLNHLLGP